jgi:hypothetical protein
MQTQIKSPADIIATLTRIRMELIRDLAALREKRIRDLIQETETYIKETKTQTQENKKHPMELRPRRSKATAESPPQSSSGVSGPNNFLDLGKFFHPSKSIEDEMKSIAIDLDKEEEDPMVAEDLFYGSEDTKSEDIIEEDDALLVGDKVRLYYFNKVVARGIIREFNGGLAKVEIIELYANLGERFGRPLPYDEPHHWLKNRGGRISYTTKEILWSVTDLDKL